MSANSFGADGPRALTVNPASDVDAESAVPDRMAFPPARSQAGAAAPRADGAPVAAPTPSGIADVDALLWFNGWRDGALTFSFPTAADQYTDYTSTSGAEFPTFSPLSLEFREAVRQILGGGALEGGAAVFSYGSIASFTNLGFSEVAGGGGTMRFANSEVPGTAYAYLPFSASGEGGDTWFNAAYMNARAAPAPGTYAWLTTMHEIGHALGLIHAHEGNGLTSTAVSTALDSIEFTVMSYRSYVGAPLTGYTAEAGGYAQTFMMLDIRALQQLYGADFTVNDTDTTYSWNPATGEMSLNGAVVGAPYANRVFLTVWDGGGNDTYDFSNYGDAGAVIDLNPGGYSLFSDVQRANLGDGNYARGNVFNALQYNGDIRSLIENAIGTAGDDTITGNHVANVLDGLDGNDVLDGGGGADRLTGGLGDDTYYVDNLGDVVTEARGEGADTVFSSVSFNAQVRGAVVETIILTGTARTAIGDVFSNTLIGNASQNVLDGYKGADTLEGRGGNDLYTVDNVGDVVIEAAGGGIDTVRSSISFTLGETLENLFLLGGGDIDATGNDGLNTIRGARGDNVITGRGGIDVLTGGGGADRFVYETLSDTAYGTYDRIRDLSADDVIDLRGIDADATTVGTNEAFSLVDDFSGQAGEMTLTYVAASRYTILAGDVDGDGVADMRIVLTGNHESFAGIWW